MGQTVDTANDQMMCIVLDASGVTDYAGGNLHVSLSNECVSRVGHFGCFT